MKSFLIKIYHKILVYSKNAHYFRHFWFWRDSRVSIWVLNFLSLSITMLASRLDSYSTAALTTPEKLRSIWKLVELKILDLVIICELVFPYSHQLLTTNYRHTYMAKENLVGIYIVLYILIHLFLIETTYFCVITCLHAT